MKILQSPLWFLNVVKEGWTSRSSTFGPCPVNGVNLFQLLVLACQPVLTSPAICWNMRRKSTHTQCGFVAAFKIFYYF